MYNAMAMKRKLIFKRILARSLPPVILTAGIAALPAIPARGQPMQDALADASASVLRVAAYNALGDMLVDSSGVVVGENEVATTCRVVEVARLNRCSRGDIHCRQVTNNLQVHIPAVSDSGEYDHVKVGAEIVIENQDRDLCLLFAGGLSELPDSIKPKTAVAASTEGLAEGQQVFAVGIGIHGPVPSLSQVPGTLSWSPYSFDEGLLLIQTDMDITPASSGGGLFNANGELLGITIFKWNGRRANAALPVQWLQELQHQGKTELEAARTVQECVENPDYECVLSAALSAARAVEHPVDGIEAMHGIIELMLREGNDDAAGKIFQEVESTPRFAEILRRYRSGNHYILDSRGISRYNGAFQTSKAELERAAEEEKEEREQTRADSNSP